MDHDIHTIRRAIALLQHDLTVISDQLGNTMVQLAGLTKVLVDTAIVAEDDLARECEQLVEDVKKHIDQTAEQLRQEDQTDTLDGIIIA